MKIKANKDNSKCQKKMLVERMMNFYRTITVSFQQSDVLNYYTETNIIKLSNTE